MEDDHKKKWNTASKKIGKQPKKSIILKKGRRPQKKEDDLNKNKNLFSIPLKFRGKPFLGLAQLSKIFKSVNT